MNSLFRLCVCKPVKLGAVKAVRIPSSSFHAGRYALGLEEFLEVKTANDTSTNGRAWTPSDLRKKVKRVLQNHLFVNFILIFNFPSPFFVYICRALMTSINFGTFFTRKETCY